MHRSRALPSNITIDDTVPNSNNDTVTYDPPNAWNTRDQCLGGNCPAVPDVNKLHSGTWHASTATQTPFTATTIFRGSAVYVYAALPPYKLELVPTTAVMFYIDGVMMKEFNAPPGTDYIYNALVYENSSLPFNSHNLTIVNGKIGVKGSLFILDRIDYSTTVSTNTSPKLPPGGIVGIILGSLAGVIVLAIITLYLRRRYRKMDQDDTQDVSPWVLEDSIAPYDRPEKGLGGNSRSGAPIMDGRPPSYQSHGWL